MLTGPALVTDARPGVWRHHQPLASYIHQSDVSQSGRRTSERKEGKMLTWAIIFGVAALVLAVFGFRGAAGVALTITKLLVAVFLIVFLVTLILAVL
jgi:uncharacterized membrane protein YtjA (UPF0391 family)